MHKLILASILALPLIHAQKHPLQELVDAARVGSPALSTLLGKGLPELNGRDGVIVWGQEFLFAVKSSTPAKVSIDKQTPLEMKPVAGTEYGAAGHKASARQNKR